MKIAISGATGFIGSTLNSAIRADGHEVILLSRDCIGSGVETLANRLSGVDVVINLAGEPVLRPWTTAHKERVAMSRLRTTRLLVEAMERLEHPPHTFISTSSVSLFDDVGRYDEDATPNGTGFLATLCEQWEASAFDANALGVRTVVFRLGLVLGEQGGLMRRILTPFKLGLGGRLGNASQGLSWIHIDDLLAAYRKVITNDGMRGVYHLCAPNPGNHEQLTRLIGEAVAKPTPIALSKAALRMLFGEGVGWILGGQTAVSRRLPDAGFDFTFPTLEQAVREVAGVAANHGRRRSQRLGFRQLTGNG